MTATLEWSAVLPSGPRPLWSHLPGCEADDPRDSVMIKKLGSHSWDRLSTFRYDYFAGWGEGSGKPLSPRAVEALYRFVETATFSRANKPSLFLTNEGTLELCWEDQAGRAIDTEFTPAGVRYTVDARGLQGFASFAEINDIATQLTRS
jgi:hypothetical protein